MKLTIDCPHGAYNPQMFIFCEKAGAPCGHQYFKKCKGWSVLTEGAATCPLRGEDNGKNDKARS